MDAMILSRQWASRPADQRFLTMQELHEFNVDKRRRSVELGTALRHLRVSATPQNSIVVRDPKKDGAPAFFTNWAFGQLCQRARVPAAHYRELPAAIAVQGLQWMMERDDEESKLLVRTEPIEGVDFDTSSSEVRAAVVNAVTSATYGRIYDEVMTQAILRDVDLDVWKVPSASYASTDPKRATTLYGSDRDCFVCLVDDQNAIEVPGQNGVDTLFRGFIARNSEVGAATFDLFLFMYRMICDNRIIHGLGQNVKLKIRHTAGGPTRFLHEAQPALQKYLTSGTQETVEFVQRAREKVLAKNSDDVATWLRQRGFTKSDAEEAVEGVTEEGNPLTAWNVMNALTQMAHDKEHGDERIAFEARAGYVLDCVAL